MEKGKRYRRLISVIIFGFLLPITAVGKEVKLFDKPGVQKTDYEQRLSSVVKGDVLAFSNGRNFKIRKVIHEGSDHLYAVDGGKVLRVSSYRFPDGTLDQAYVNGYHQLKAHGVPMIDVFLQESYPLEYVITRYYPHLETLEFFLINQESYSHSKRNKRFQALIEFAALTFHFKEISDFNPSNVAYDGKRWILIDWEQGHVLASKHDKETAFKPRLFSDIPGVYLKEMVQAICLKRGHDSEISHACFTPLGR